MGGQQSYVGWRVDVPDWQGPKSPVIVGPAPEQADVPPPPCPPMPTNQGVVIAFEEVDWQGHLYQVEFDNHAVWSMYLPHPGVVLTPPGFAYTGVPDVQPAPPTGPRRYAEYTLSPLARVRAFLRRKPA